MDRLFLIQTAHLNPSCIHFKKKNSRYLDVDDRICQTRLPSLKIEEEMGFWGVVGGLRVEELLTRVVCWETTPGHAFLPCLFGEITRMLRHRVPCDSNACIFHLRTDTPIPARLFYCSVWK